MLYAGRMNATVSSKQLGRLLKAMREAAGLTVRAVAEEMAYSPAKVSRQESGTHPISPAELSHLVLRLYGGTEDDLGRLEYYRRQAMLGRGWWSDTGVSLSEHYEAYLGTEAAAEHIQTFELEIVTGLLQTEGYARAQHMLYSRYTAEDVDRYVAIRMKRQERLPHLKLDAVVSEAAIRRCGVHPACDQLPHLIKLLERRPSNITFRVLPFDSGIHDVPGPFSVLYLPEGVLPPVGYLEHLAGGHIVEEGPAVTRMTERFASLREEALNPSRTLELIRDHIRRSQHDR